MNCYQLNALPQLCDRALLAFGNLHLLVKPRPRGVGIEMEAELQCPEHCVDGLSTHRA